MIINKDTQVCISIAERPGNFGTTIHNIAYKAMHLNFVYKSFAVKDLEGAVRGIRALGIRGCSVSMPFKIDVLTLLDELDESAKTTGAANTIVNDGGKLTGYNTDLTGARVIIKSLKLAPSDRILVLGAGGAARAILSALGQLGFTNVVVAARNFKMLEDVHGVVQWEQLSWDDRETAPADLLVNATPIGMYPQDDAIPVSAEFIQRVGVVFDLVVSPLESRLISCARTLGKNVAPGYLMSLEQTIAQFELYSKTKAPRHVMEKAFQELLGARSGS